jgi:hypothetical protein
MREMSLGAWGDGGDQDLSGYTEDRMEDAFRAGAQQMRELLARFVEHDGHADLANSLRANWIPNWGKDPGKPQDICEDPWAAI